MRVQEETAALVRFDREQDVTNPERVAHGQLERPEGQAFYTLRSGFDHIEAPSSNSGAQGMLSISRRSVAGERVVCEEPNCKITSGALSEALGAKYRRERAQKGLLRDLLWV